MGRWNAGRRHGAAWVLGVCLALAAGSAAADPGTPGRESYELYCAGCHGPAASTGRATRQVRPDAGRARAPDAGRAGAPPARTMAERIARGRDLAPSESACGTVLRSAFRSQPYPALARRGTALGIFRYLEAVRHAGETDTASKRR